MKQVLLTLTLLLFFYLDLSAQPLITPIPLDIKTNSQKVLLGKLLFFDTRLSANNTISCASCHIIQDGGDDNLKVSFGIDGKTGTRNSPTILNSTYNIVQFWDGGAKDLKDQAKGPIHNPVEMASNFPQVISKLTKDKRYVKLFSQIYHSKINGSNITDAIAEFEKSLITPNSKFDKFLRGDKFALDKNELHGYKLFKEYGCISCHNGINIGGNLLQKVGVVQHFDTIDLGRYNITKKDEDKFYFKVPSLRNVQLTAPYFHDGSVETLKEAVVKMVQYQVGYMLEEKDINDIVKFLETFTGDIPKIDEGNQ